MRQLNTIHLGHDTTHKRVAGFFTGYNLLGRKADGSFPTTNLFADINDECPILYN